MSKKYFSKFIPVEEEIKEGDIVLYKGDIIEVNEFTHDDTVVVFNLDGTESRYNEIDEKVFLELGKKVKLFLYSKDIQVGDTLWYKGEWYKDASKTMIESAPLEALKILGEISPEALSYVKEGGEFDEEEWQLMSRYYTNMSPTPKDNYRYSVDGRLVWVQILNPSCKHFH